MSNIGVFLECIRPNIEDIDEVYEKLSESNKNYDELSNIISFVDNDSKKIIDYSNQDYVVDNLNLVSLDSSSYDAIKYLVSTNDKNVFCLPQYIDSIAKLDAFIMILKEKMNSLSTEIDYLSVSYFDKYISKKYYDMYANDKVFVIDAQEFNNFLNRLDLEDSVKIDVLKKAINDSCIGYKNDIDGDDQLVNDVLSANKHYLSNNYLSLVDNVIKYIDLSKEVEELKDNNEFDNDNVIFAKKIWLIKQINDNKENIDLARGYINQLNEINDMIKKEKKEG